MDVFHVFEIVQIISNRAKHHICNISEQRDLNDQEFFITEQIRNSSIFFRISVKILPTKIKVKPRNKQFFN